MRSVHLVDCGAITAIGHDAPRTVASLRSGLEGFTELSFLGKSGAQLKGAPVRGYAEGLLGYARYEALAIRALRPLVERIPASERRFATVIVGLPHRDRPGVPVGLAKALCTALADRLGLDPARVLSMEEGRTSVFAGLEHPGFLEDEGSHPIIGGVDVLTDPAALEGLSERGELKEEWDGYLPGEAAAFVRLSSRRGPGYWGRPASRIAGIGLGVERATGSSDDPVVGRGLTQALRAAAADANITDNDIGLRINDLSGMRVGFEDDGMAYARFYRTIGQRVIDVWHLGSYVGETGAAAGALALIWAAAAVELEFVAPAPIMITCSEATRRAAVVLQPATAGGRAAGFERGRVSRTRVELNPRPVREEIEEPDPGLVIPDLDDTPRELAMRDLSEAASLILLREGHFEDVDAPWADIAGYERRLLASLDALAWSRDIANELARERIESEDIEDVAAAILVLGSGHLSEDAWRDIAQAFSQGDTTRSREVARYVAMCPAPEIDKYLAASLHDGADEALLTGLLETLAMRGVLTEGHLTPLLDAGRTDLLPSLLAVVERVGLASAMKRIDALCRTAPDAVRPADMLAYVQFGAPGLPFFPIEEYLAEAPLVVAFASLRRSRSFLDLVPEDAELFPALVEAMGWAGETASISRLIPLLGGDDEIAASAANALNLILGTDHTEELEVPIEIDDGVETTTSVTRLTRDPDHWLAVWRALGSPETSRLRHGRKWEPRAALMHLRRERPATAERISACREFAACTGGGHPLDPRQLVSLQHDALRKIDAATPPR
jgi:3-oxoacyl-[acyl-carrier-protein] synthase-1